MPSHYGKKNAMSEADLQGAVDIASRYYNAGQSAPPRRRSLYREAKDAIKSKLYQRRIKKKGREMEKQAARTPATRSVEKGMEQSGVSNRRIRSFGGR
jgi:hypothetical protein